jgi:hypothetical protein
MISLSRADVPAEIAFREIRGHTSGPERVASAPEELSV